MNDRALIGPWVRRFLLQHVVAERNLARNTQASYRDTLALLLPFVNATTKTPIDRLTLEELSPLAVRRFLDPLETIPGSTGASRINTPGAITTHPTSLGIRCPQTPSWLT